LWWSAEIAAAGSEVFEELSGGAVQPGCSNGLRQISEVQIGSSTWTPSWYGYDGEGHVRTLADASVSITDTYDNDGPMSRKEKASAQSRVLHLG
jgi:hypothetical protein